MTVTLNDIENAARLLDGTVLRTPTLPAPILSALCGTEVVLKLENLQLTGSFKTRGALVRMLALDESQRQRGVVAMSAGNHAQGVAWHAARLGIPATIVMPRGTPFTKMERTQSLGAQVVLEGDSLSDSAEHAQMLGQRHGYAFIHPYDDEKVIAGQGTVALEMLADDPALDCLIVPVGGGGLISGIAVAAKALKPDIEVYGVQAALYPSMAQTLRGETPHCSGQTIAEGIAVKAPGRLTVPIIRDLVKDILLAGEAALEHAVQMLVDRQKIVTEGAGAAPLAALMQNRSLFAGRRVGLVISGGNMDARLLASVLLRGLAEAGRMARLRIEISDAPGALAKVAQMIGDGAGNIIEIYHQRLFHDVPVKFAELDVVIEATGAAHVRAIIDRLHAAGYPTRLLSSTAAPED